MAERPRELGNFKGWATVRLNFRFKCYVSRQHLWTVSVCSLLCANPAFDCDIPINDNNNNDDDDKMRIRVSD